jgi:glucosamine kinase
LQERDIWSYTGIIHQATWFRLLNIRYLIGVDGGGTGTRVKLVSADGTVRAAGQAGPSALGQGIEQAWRHVGEAVEDAFSQLGEPLQPAACVLSLGLAGAHVGPRCEAFLRRAPSYAAVLLHDDGWTSLIGAHRGAPGAVIAVGTGSIGEVLRLDGTRATVGGWGFRIGDEGSGAWLGLRAVRIAHRAQDGRAAAGPLAKAVCHVIGDSREAMLQWGEQATQASYAQLAPLVFETEAHDPAAAALIHDAVQAIELHAQALDPSGALPLAVVGSLGAKLQPRLSLAVRTRCVAPAGDSADGALWLARQHLERHGSPQLQAGGAA